MGKVVKGISCPACIRGTGYINRWVGTAECEPGISRIPGWKWRLRIAGSDAVYCGRTAPKFRRKNLPPSLGQVTINQLHIFAA